MISSYNMVHLVAWSNSYFTLGAVQTPGIEKQNKKKSQQEFNTSRSSRALHSNSCNTFQLTFLSSVSDHVNPLAAVHLHVFNAAQHAIWRMINTNMWTTCLSRCLSSGHSDLSCRITSHPLITVNQSLYRSLVLHEWNPTLATAKDCQSIIHGLLILRSPLWEQCVLHKTH